MKVANTQPFQVVYAILQHEYLGYLFQAFVVQKNSKNQLTLQYQSLSPKNMKEFTKGMDETDQKLIHLIDTIQQDTVMKKFSDKKTTIADFFIRIFEKNKDDDKNKQIIKLIAEYLENKKSQILPLLRQKLIFIAGKDGNPTWRSIHFCEEPASVLFHFRRNDDNTHYFPTIKYEGELLDFRYKNAFLVCNTPAWMVLEDKLYHFEKNVDGNKIKPFLNKKFILIEKNMEATYYEKFVKTLISQFDVYAKGFEIKHYQRKPTFELYLQEQSINEVQLFETQNTSSTDTLTAPASTDSKIQIELRAFYGTYEVRCADKKEVIVHLEKGNDSTYVFHKIKRDMEYERDIIQLLAQKGLPLQEGKILLRKTQAFGWISEHYQSLLPFNIKIFQNQEVYFIGSSSFRLVIEEKNDWFDIHAIVHFGEFEIPFAQIRKLILQRKTEFELPNGKIAVIPEAWFEQYNEILHFTHEDCTLRKQFVSLVYALQKEQKAEVTLSRKLERMQDFATIEDVPLPQHFRGTLRPYQKAGYNWLQFLQEYRFGGCLADDMGLGKTVQTLAFLQSQKEANIQPRTSLLVIPTSLIYNWQLEAQKFTPQLKMLCYAGSQRNKNIHYFEHFDVIITSYGTLRVDIDILEKYHFNYLILDESQAIKNPTAAVSQAVRRLKGQNKLILTGTPLENSTMDLWSQMNFINAGLLGTQSFFKQHFQLPIEKKQDRNQLQKLATLIKPFILRRHKSQVATDLPPKIENVQYCLMSTEQEEYYEKIKSKYRNEILQLLEQEGMQNKSQMLILQGLTQLRQLASHPRLVDTAYEGSSGKIEDVLFKIENIVGEKSKVLIFSSFVKHLNLFKEAFEQRGWKYAYLTGETQDRAKEVKKFQEDNNVALFLISLKAGGTGLNLTAAEYVFLLDPWWNPAVENQAIDRAHRIGQTKTVFTYRFITKNSVEEKILLLQEKKSQLAGELIITEESFVKKLTKDDIRALLE